MGNEIGSSFSRREVVVSVKRINRFHFLGHSAAEADILRKESDVLSEKIVGNLFPLPFGWASRSSKKLGDREQQNTLGLNVALLAHILGVVGFKNFERRLS